MSGNLYIVMLRQPRKDDPRDDPYWEFGSFGCTGCHRTNLLHPKNSQIREGDLLAFIQGGHHGPRLLLVTPPVKRIDHFGGGPKGRLELRWDPSAIPFRYECVPTLFGSTAPGRYESFPLLAESIARTNRSSIAEKLASRFRARASPLEPRLALEIKEGFANAVKRAKDCDFITRYRDALPWCDCPRSPRERQIDYRRLLKELDNTAKNQSGKARRCR